MNIKVLCILAAPPPLNPNLEPRVNFFATVIYPTSSSLTVQVQRIQNDLRGNLTNYFSPTSVVVALRLVSATATGRRLLTEVHIGITGGSGDCGEEVRDLSRQAKGGQKSYAVRQLPVRKSGSLEGEAVGVRSVGRTGRSMLQSTQAALDVSVTFPTTIRQANSYQIAFAFRQALEVNSSSVLGSFEAGWGAVGVTNATLTLNTESSATTSTPPPPPVTADPGKGSIGSFIGAVVAAVLGCTFLAGRAFTRQVIPCIF